MRNISDIASKRYCTISADGMKDIFTSKTKEEAGTRFRKLAGEMGGKADKAIEILENGLEDALSGRYCQRSTEGGWLQAICKKD